MMIKLSGWQDRQSRVTVVCATLTFWLVVLAVQVAVAWLVVQSLCLCGLIQPPEPALTEQQRAERHRLLVEEIQTEAKARREGSKSKATRPETTPIRGAGPTRTSVPGDPAGTQAPEPQAPTR